MTIKTYIGLLLICFINVSAQNIDSSNLYFQALELHLKYLKESAKAYPEIKSPEIYYVEQNEYTTNGFSTIINDQKIKIINQKEINEILKKDKNITVITVKPAIWRNGKFEINVIDYIISRKRTKFYHLNLGGNSYSIVVENVNLVLKEERIPGQYD